MTQTTASIGAIEVAAGGDIPAVGSLIANKYEVEGVLGRGGMGVVLAAKHLALDERVAIKTLHTHLAAESDALSRFLREARTIAKLKSPNVVRVQDVDTLPNGVPYIVMELLDGEDVAARIARGPVTIDESVRWVRQACEAMREAHALGVVHRDLKPANLFLCRGKSGETLKVLDFGISRILDDSSVVRGMETTANVVVGSRSYMAPEQHEGARNADERSDIWALGVILYQLLTGKLPYVGESAAVVYAQIVTSATPSPHGVREEIPETLSKVVERCLQRYAVDRYQTVDELSAALEPFASPVATERAKAVDPPSAGPSGYPRWIWPVGVAVLGACVAAAITLSLVHRASPPSPAGAAAIVPATAAPSSIRAPDDSSHLMGPPSTATASVEALSPATPVPTASNAKVWPIARPKPVAAPLHSATLSVPSDPYRSRTSF